MRSRADAEDAVQDAMVIAIARLGQVRNPESFRSCLYAVVTNVCRGALRRSKREADGQLAFATYLSPMQELAKTIKVVEQNLPGWTSKAATA